MRKAAWERHYDICRVLRNWQDTCYDQRMGSDHQGLTMTQIARRLAMSPSSHLMDRIRECVKAGWIVQEKQPWGNGKIRFRFYIASAGCQLVWALDELGLKPL